MTNIDLAHYFADYLLKEGYSPTIDDDDDVVFKFEGQTYVISTDTTDVQYFRLMYLNFWSLESEEERQLAAMVAAVVNRQLKVVKVFVADNETHASVELFVNHIDDFKPVFRRSLAALQSAARAFCKGMVAARGDV
jgi:hypothetical protein